jgi:xanthine dehydrogenase YagT iron-sulfur-binding subunit
MPDEIEPQTDTGLTRRSFLKTLGTAGLGTIAIPLVGEETHAADTTSATAAAPPDASGSAQVYKNTAALELRINGKAQQVTVEPRTTLLDTLRMKLDLTGSKLVCDRGTCGGCTVLMDGKPVTSCMVLAIDAQGHEITTIEGLSLGADLHPVQKAFVERDALQCGFCTPGFVVATKAALEKIPDASLQQFKEEISGNICRCGTYNHIFEAAARAQTAMNGSKRIADELAAMGIAQGGVA